MAPDLPWRSIQPLPKINGDVAGLLATIDDQRRVWEETLAFATPREAEEGRKRSLRRHAIETGVIERLYDLDWGTTEALIAEGLTPDAAAHDGGITENTLAVIRDQYTALEYLADAARGGRALSLQFIRELHVLITRHQATYDGQDQFGRIVQAPLPHGEWKQHPNHAIRDDGSRVEFAPPLQVQSEMELLLKLYEESASAHPVVRSAWLHHRFTIIHPFADGNGRVARALTLLVLLEAHYYAPLVVDRRQRHEYIAALESANSDDLRPLIRFFARLEGIALRSELIRPVEAPAGVGAIEVAQAYADRLRVLAGTKNTAKVRGTEQVAAAVHGRLAQHFSNFREQFLNVFRPVDKAAQADTYQAVPGEEAASWWRAQLIRTANAVDFYTNLLDGSWWTYLRLTVLGRTMRYVVAIQKVGRGETGVLAITAFAETLDPHPEAEDARPAPLLHPDPDDSVTLIYTDSVEARWPDVTEFVERTLAAAIASFSNSLG